MNTKKEDKIFVDGVALDTSVYFDLTLADIPLRIEGICYLTFIDKMTYETRDFEYAHIYYLDKEISLKEYFKVREHYANYNKDLDYLVEEDFFDLMNKNLWKMYNEALSTQTLK